MPKAIKFRERKNISEKKNRGRQKTSVREIKYRAAIKNLCKSAERRFRQSLNKRIKKKKRKKS